MNNLLLALNRPLTIGIAVGIAIGVVVVIIVLIWIFLHKKNNAVGSDADKNKEDRDLIEANSRAVEALLVLAENNEEFKKELRELQEQIKYLVPSPKEEVLEFDKKIRNLIGDMKIALTKTDGEDDKKTENLLKQIKLTMADRGVVIR